MIETGANANKAWRIMADNGAVGIVVIAVSLFVGYLSWRLYQQEISLRRSASMLKKISDFHRSSKNELFSPIRWNYENFLNHIGTNIESISDLKQLSDHPDICDGYIIRIEAFQILGYAKTGPLRLTGGYILSLITGEKIPVRLDGHELDGVEIPAYESFKITAKFSCPADLQTENFRSGLPIGEFRRKWREFRFVLKLEGRKAFSEEFTAEEVDFYLYRCVTGLQWKPGNTRSTILPSGRRGM